MRVLTKSNNYVILLLKTRKSVNKNEKVVDGMLGPKEYESYRGAIIKNSDMEMVDSVAKSVEESLIKSAHSQFEPWAQAFVNGNFSVELRDAVAKKFVEAGWTRVCHVSNNELGTGRGTVTFVLLTEETCNIWKKCHNVNEWHCVE